VQALCFIANPLSTLSEETRLPFFFQLCDLKKKVISPLQASVPSSANGNAMLPSFNQSFIEGLVFQVLVYTEQRD
jgi:hypothetical protein